MLKQSSALILALLATALSPNEAHAYFDPGTGSMILQVLVGGVIGGLMFIKLTWRKILQFFNRSAGQREKE